MYVVCVISLNAFDVPGLVVIIKKKKTKKKNYGKKSECSGVALTIKQPVVLFWFYKVL